MEEALWQQVGHASDLKSRDGRKDREPKSMWWW